MLKARHILLLLLLTLQLPLKAQIDTDRMTIIGRNALYFEDYVLAIQYFNQVIQAKPYLSEPYYFRAIGKYSLDDLKGAEQDVSKALEINPYIADAWNLRGIIRQKLGRTPEALSDYQSGLQLEPENINLLINKGIAELRDKDYEAAINTYSTALQHAPKLLSALLNRGHAKVASGDTLGGLSDFSKAVEANPYVPDGYANRAVIHYQLNEYEKALADLDKAVELRPEDARFYMNRGIIRYQLDDLRGTLSDFDKVIELEPRNAMAYSNRGILRAQVGDTNRAIEDFSRVLALRSDDLLTLYYRAMLYTEIGSYREALADLNIVADNYPDFAPVYETRAHVRQNLGDTRGAELDYGTAVKLNLERREQVAHNEKSSGATANGEEEKPARKATRSENDRDIRNYNKVAVLDDFGNEPDEEAATNPLRGRIQNRNIVIDMEGIFGITYYPNDSLVHRLPYFHLEIDRINRQRPIPRTLRLANAEIEADREKAAAIFSQISALTEQLKTAPEADQATLYFARGTLYNTVLNLNNALDDFNRVLSIAPDHLPALFNRAYTRFKMVETIRSMEAELPEAWSLQTGGTLTRPAAGSNEGEERRILDYDLINDDLQHITDLTPNFAFAHYNLGVVQAQMRNFETAITHFSAAIAAQPDFAEAWFNRGLIRIFLEQESEGTLDLSKAGELGIFKAYNVIKRYGIGAQPWSDSEEEEE